VFYVAQEGEESAARFSFAEEPVAGFTLAFGVAVPLPAGSPGGGPGQLVADLAPLRESGLPAVAALAAVASDSAAPAGGAAAAAGLAEVSPAVLLLLSGVPERGVGAANPGGGDEPEGPAAADDSAGAAAGPAGGEAGPAVESTVIGVDEALRRHENKARERLFDPPPEPAPDREGLLDEVFRRRLPGWGWDLLSPAGSLPNPGPDVREAADAPALIPPGADGTNGLAEPALSAPQASLDPFCGELPGAGNLSARADPWMTEVRTGPGEELMIAALLLGGACRPWWKDVGAEPQERRRKKAWILGSTD
jgi:hypothetical protein